MNNSRRSELSCPVCGKVKNKSQFNKSPISSQGYLYFCKTCTNTKLKSYIDMLGNEGAALWCLCMEQGVPFMKQAWETAYANYQKDKTLNLFLLYLEAYDALDEKPTGLWDSDVMLSDFFSQNHVDTVDLQKQRIMDWGHYEVSDYEFLEAKMYEYTSQFKNMKPSQVNRYRDLCKAELRKRKLEEDPDAQQKDITAAGKEIMDLMKMLKIDNFQSDTRSDVERQLEYQAAIMEQTKPCEDEDILKYQDFCGCQKLEKQLMRPLRNLIAGTKDYPYVSKE